MCHDHAFCFCLLALGPLGTVRSLGKTPTFGPAAPTAHPGPANPLLLLGNDPKSFCKFFPKFSDLRSAAFFARFSKILASIKDFSKKQVSQLLSCRGGLGEAPYNTPRHSLQRCRSKALKDVGIRKLTLFENVFKKLLKVFKVS